MNELKLPGIEILEKYGYSILKQDDKYVQVSVSKQIPHFDRQKLFGFCWKNDVRDNTVYYYDIVLSLMKQNMRN